VVASVRLRGELFSRGRMVGMAADNEFDEVAERTGSLDALTNSEETGCAIITIIVALIICAVAAYFAWKEK